MANIIVPVADAVVGPNTVTGTSVFDSLTVVEGLNTPTPEDDLPVLVDDDGSLALVEGEYVINVNGDLTNATEVEAFNFGNGTFTTAASPAALQYVQSARLETGILLNQENDATDDDTGAIGDSGTVFAWNGSSLAALDNEFTIASINGVDAEESFELDGLGTVDLNDDETSFDFTAFESFLASFGWGNRGIVEFDVEFANEDDDSFTQTFSLTVEGGATDDADFFNTSNTEDNDSGEGDDGAVILDGLGGDDVILGDEGSDFIFGNDGDDRIFAGAKDGDDVDDADDAGDDIFAGGAGNDFVNGGVGADLLIGDGVGEEIFDVDVDLSADTDGSDTINGGDDDDVIVTGSLEEGDNSNDASAFSVNGGGDYVFEGSDYTVTGDADDQAFGGDGDDLVIGAGGDDLLGGGNGGDDIAGGAGNDRIFGGADDGNDRLWGEGGDDTIFGSDGVDVIRGGADDDVLFNGAGDDMIVNGGSGQDTLWGGAGDDELTGGADEDTFAFTSGNGNDTINDFDLGEDSIDFTEIAGLSADNIENFAAEVNGDLTIYYAEDASVTVENATLNDLGSIDFMFA